MAKLSILMSALLLTGCAVVFKTSRGHKAFGWPSTVREVASRMSPNSSWGFWGSKGECVSRDGECER